MALATVHKLVHYSDKVAMAEQCYIQIIFPFPPSPSSEHCTLSLQKKIRKYILQSNDLVITGASPHLFSRNRNVKWAYGKAGNGSGMETGNGKWKWKLETEI